MNFPFFFSDPLQLQSVEENERQLTTCMLQLVSTLTLRSIKNTGMLFQLILFRHFFNRCMKFYFGFDIFHESVYSFLKIEINPAAFISFILSAYINVCNFIYFSIDLLFY